MKFETVLFAAAFLLLAIVSLPRNDADEPSAAKAAAANTQIENGQAEDNAIITAQSGLRPDEDEPDDDNQAENDLR